MDNKELDDLRREVEALSERVRRLEGQLSGLAVRPPAGASAAGPGAAPSAAVPGAAPSAAVPGAAPPAPVPGPASGLPTGEPESLESRIGGLWLNRIGVVALVSALAFFLKYAFDHGWVSEYGRIAIGLATGVLLLGAGEHYLSRGRMVRFGIGLGGAGIAAFYVTIHAALSFYGLIDPLTAKVLMSAVTLLALGLALRRNLVAFAVVGLAGGYLTPLLTSGAGAYVALYTYLLVFSLVILAVSLGKRWHGLSLLGLLFTYTLYIAGLNASHPGPNAISPGELAAYMWFLSLFHLLFMVAGPAGGLCRREPADGWLIAGSVVSSLLYVSLAGALLFGGHRGLLALALLGWGAFCLAVMVVVGCRGQQRDPRLGHWMLVLAFGYVAFAVPFGLDARWVTVAWLVQALAVVALGIWRRASLLRWLGISLLLVTAGKLVLVDLAGLETVWRILMFLASGLVFLMASYLYQRFLGPQQGQAA